MRAHLLIVCGLLVLMGGLDASAREAHRSFREFYPTGEFDLYVDGAKQPGEILFSRRAAAYLIAPEGSADCFLLMQRLKTVSAVPLDLMRHENGNVDLPQEARPKRVGRFSLALGGIRIESTALRGMLKSRPPLLGPQSGAEVLNHAPQYGLVMRKFRKNDAALTRLRGHKGARVEVLFGSWCPRCQQTLGSAMRVEQELAGGAVKFLYHGLPRPPAAWKDERFVATHSKALPTAIVWVGKQEVGRIAPKDFRRFDQFLARILTP